MKITLGQRADHTPWLPVTYFFFLNDFLSQSGLKFPKRRFGEQGGKSVKLYNWSVTSPLGQEGSTVRHPMHWPGGLSGHALPHTDPPKEKAWSNSKTSLCHKDREDLIFYFLAPFSQISWVGDPEAESAILKPNRANEIWWQLWVRAWLGETAASFQHSAEGLGTVANIWGIRPQMSPTHKGPATNSSFTDTSAPSTDQSLASLIRLAKKGASPDHNP